jgi:redox-sensitive bicupin YhaK (pirin superfamily)
VTHEVASGRAVWLHCATGQVAVNDLSLVAGDGVAMTGEPSLVVNGVAHGASELLLFDLA